MSALKAVLFDLDETLFDHSYSVAHSMDLLRRDHTALQSRSVDELLAEYKRLLEEVHIEVLAGRLNQDVARVQRMRALFAFCGVEVSEHVLLEAVTLHRERYQAVKRAVPGALELLRRLKSRWSIGVVTNNMTEEQRIKLEDCGLTPLVDELITSEDCGFAKPDSRIFHIALERVGCAAEEAIMVGDSWEMDVVGARNAGIHPIWFNRFGQPQPEDEQVAEIRSFEDRTPEQLSELFTLR
jgi:HAD superfamily hydrolase (TIGR01549 family)